MLHINQLEFFDYFSFTERIVITIDVKCLIRTSVHDWLKYIILHSVQRMKRFAEGNMKIKNKSLLIEYSGQIFIETGFKLKDLLKELRTIKLLWT